jgi:flagellar biosynthetic protein FliQ
METSDAIMIDESLLTAALLLSAPVVIVSLVVGVCISIAQTVTSIQEQTLTFAPRIVAVVGIVILLTPWYLSTLRTFTYRVFERMADIGL